jgi:hypothetical protein
MDTETVIRVKRLIVAKSLDGARMLGMGAYRECSQARINIAAQAALVDPDANFSPEERELVASVIQHEPGTSI